MPDDLQHLRANIERLPDEVTARLRAVAWRKSRDVMARAKQILLSKTHGTGTTARAIVIHEEADKKQFLVTVEHPTLPALPGWIERGTVHMRARPFMRPAADEVTPSYRAEMIAVATKTAKDLLE